MSLVIYGGEVDFVDPVSGGTAIHALIDYAQTHPDQAVSMLRQLFNSDAIIHWFCERMDIEPDMWSERDLISMKQYVLRLENQDGYNALTYATRQGVASVVVFLLQCDGVYKDVLFDVGQSSYAMYDVSELDPIVSRMVHPSKPNVLEHVVYSFENTHPKELLKEPLKSLIHLKWQLLRPCFYFWAVFHIALMVAITSSWVSYFYLRDIFRERHKPLQQNDTLNSLSLLANISETALGHNATSINEMIAGYTPSVPHTIYSFLVLPIVGLYCIIQLTDFITSMKLWIKGRCLRNSFDHYRVPMNIIRKRDLFDSILLVFCLIILLSACTDDLNFLAAIILTLGWYYMLFFTRAFRATCYFTIMMNHILLVDVGRFMLVMVFIIIGFGTSLMSLHMLHSASVTDLQPDTFISTMLLLLINRGSLDYISQSPFAVFSAILTFVYILLGTVLMFNLLIAAMSDSYTGMNEEHRDALFRKMRAKSIMIMERRIPHFIMSYLIKKRLKYNPERKTWMLPIFTSNVSEKMSPK